jgi:hypothetical protein
VSEREQKLEAEVQSLVAPLRLLVGEFSASVHAFVSRHLEELEQEITRLKHVARASQDLVSQERVLRQKAERRAERETARDHYMVCRTCRWWRPRAPSATIGECQLFSRIDDGQVDRGTRKLNVARPSDDGATVTTHHDFGCIQHDAVAASDGPGDEKGR